MIKHLRYILLIFTFIFPAHNSRIITTVDLEGEYSVPIYTLDNDLVSKQSFKTDFSIDIAYEHLLADGGDFLLFIGGEFMVGRRSSSNIALHSAYLMPMLRLSDKILVFLKGGGTILNTQQENFLLDKGLMASVGIEYSISDNISLAISGTGYDLFNETFYSPELSSIPFTQLGLGSQVQLPAVDIDMKHTKFGISVIYGF